MNANMLSFDEAYEKLLGFVRPVREIEQVDTMFAAGRVLAVAQHSTINQPPMDNSGMDGYAPYKDAGAADTTRGNHLYFRELYRQQKQGAK